MCEIGNYIMLVFLVLCSASDLRTRRIPIVLLIAMSAFISILYVAGGLKDIPASLGGFAVGIAFYLFSRCSKEAIGYGDSWIILLIGIQLGMYGVLGTVFTAFFMAALFSLALLVKKNRSKTMTIPFVPFLTIAYAGVILF